MAGAVLFGPKFGPIERNTRPNRTPNDPKLWGRERDKTPINRSKPRRTARAVPSFKTGALNHSATLPHCNFKRLAKVPNEQNRKNGTHLAPYTFIAALIAAAALPSSLRNKCA
jgi:hypothetical protein